MAYFPSEQERLADLMRQGFMKPRRVRRVAAQPGPPTSCPLCVDWHPAGQHRYWVWREQAKEPERPYLKKAEAIQAARDATSLDDVRRVVSLGRDPSHSKFKIVWSPPEMERNTRQPTAAERQRLVEAYARKIYSADRAPLRTAQRLSDRFREYQLRLSDKYPGVDLSTERFYRALESAAERWWNSRAFRGAGSDW